MDKFLINVNAKVVSSTIRRETHNGREHIVIPSRTLPFGVVMNGGLYTKEQIVANYESLEGTLAPLGHPTVDGKHVSAFSPEGINGNHIGAWNRNVRLEGNRVYLEKWVDIEVAAKTEGGKRLLERVEQLEKGEGTPIHTSVAAWCSREPVVNEKGHTWKANIEVLDHDAILLDEPGAAGPDKGVGLMVNADSAQIYIVANAGALRKLGNRALERMLEAAVDARWPRGTQPENIYRWIGEFTDEQVIIVSNSNAADAYDFEIKGGKVVLSEEGQPVKREESWVEMAVNRAKKFFNPQDKPAPNQKEGDMPITAEEQASIVKAVGESVSGIVAEQMKGVNDKVEALAVNHQKIMDQLTAGDRAKQDDKRKLVKDHLGELAANALQGDALDAVYAKFAKAAPIGTGLVGNSKDGGPDFTQVPD